MRVWITFWTALILPFSGLIGKLFTNTFHLSDVSTVWIYTSIARASQCHSSCGLKREFKRSARKAEINLVTYTEMAGQWINPCNSQYELHCWAAQGVVNTHPMGTRVNTRVWDSPWGGRLSLWDSSSSGCSCCGHSPLQAPEKWHKGVTACTSSSLGLDLRHHHNTSTIPSRAAP